MDIRGKGAVGIAIAYYSLRGHVFIPLESCGYNLIFEDGVDILRIKVISCSHKSKYGIYSVAIRTMGGNYPKQKAKKFDPTKVDVVFVVTDQFDFYAIPSEEIVAKRQISLNKYLFYKVTLDAF